MTDKPFFYDSPAVQVLPDRINYRASSLGTCLRRLYAARTGHDAKPPPPSLQAKFDEGHELEPVILKMLEDDGWALEGFQQKVELHVGINHEDKQLYMVGHVDALGTPLGANHFLPVDVKAFAQSTFDKFFGEGIAAFPHYAWQQSAYCHGLGVDEFLLPIYNKDTKELRIFLGTPTITYDDIVDRIFAIEQMAERGDNITTIACTADWGCPYSYLHDDKPIDALPDTADMRQAIANYLDCKRRIDFLTIARKINADIIAAGIPYTEDLRTFTGDGITVSIVNNPSRLNTQKVRELLTAAELDISEYTTPGVGVSIRIKENTTK